MSHGTNFRSYGTNFGSGNFYFGSGNLAFASAEALLTPFGAGPRIPGMDFK
jgi:hypothetical protein